MIPAPNIYMVLILLYLVLMGLCLTYYVLAGILNKTYLVLDAKLLTIKHGPLPFGGNVELSSSTLKQLSYQRVTFFSPREDVRDLIRDSHQILALTTDDKVIKLFSGLNSKEQALFIKRKIENFLRIKTGRDA